MVKKVLVFSLLVLSASVGKTTEVKDELEWMTSFRIKKVSCATEEKIKEIEEKIEYSFPDPLRHFFLKYSNRAFPNLDIQNAREGVKSPLYIKVIKPFKEKFKDLAEEYFPICIEMNGYHCIHKNSGKIFYLQEQTDDTFAWSDNPEDQWETFNAWAKKQWQTSSKD